MMARFLSHLAAAAARRSRLVLALAAVLALAGAGLAAGLHASAATSTFVSSSSPEYRATQGFYQRFGEEPVVVLVRGNLEQLVLSSDIDRLAALEGCLSGQVPADRLAQEGGVDGPCGQLGRAHSVKVVFGPGSFLNAAANRLDEQLTEHTRQAQAEAHQAQVVIERAARARGLSAAQAQALGQEASRITIARFQEGLVTLALTYGLTERPSLDSPKFVSGVVFDSTKPAGTPKQRFAYLFPNRDSALISVRMRAGLSEAQRAHTIALIRKAVAMPQWKLAHGESYAVTGVPAIASDLPAAIGRSIELLMIVVAALMAAALGLIYTGRPRLLPLALALVAGALTFGGVALLGASLTMASVAVLPVLVGLAVDYAIQFQSRTEETFAHAALAGPTPGGSPAAPGPGAPSGAGEPGSPERVALIARAARAGGPSIVTAGAASAAAMVALWLSPVPMVRGFGALLIAGMAVGLACAFVLGAASLARVRRSPRPSRRPRSRALDEVAAAWRGAGELLRENALVDRVRHAALVGSVRRPGRVLGVGLALAALGWGLDTQTHVETDITKLVPQNIPSVRNLGLLEHTTGVAGEIDLMVTGHNITSPHTIEWMSEYQSSILKKAGYSSSRGCGSAPVCPAFSLPDLFSGGPTANAKPAKLSQAEVNALLDAIPPYFSQDVITPDRRAATLAFGIRVMGLQEQQRLIETMRSRLHPPPGVSASLVGLPVLAAQAGSQVADPLRRLLTLLVGLAAVAAVLLLAFRGDRRRALTPLVPIVLATGWSSLVLFAVRVPLNPMSVMLGALVIAISTEFSVLLSERHRQERLAGYDTMAALRRAYGRTGAAVAASGVTAIAGFGVLALSDIRMLRDFGVVTLIDLSVALVGVLVALPAVLVLAAREERAREGRAVGRPRRGPLARVRARAGHEPV
jgi:predicted RND superfamily exporter protein